MTRLGAAVLLGTLIIGGPVAGSPTSQTSPADRTADLRNPVVHAIPDSYIVVFKDEVSRPDAAAKEMARRHGLSLDHVYTRALKGFAAKMPARAIPQLRDDPRVDFISPDLALEADGADALVSGDSVPTGVRRVVAATASTAHQPSNVAVAVLDTGVDLAHPDLNAVSGTDCTAKKRGSLAHDDNGHG